MPANRLRWALAHGSTELAPDLAESLIAEDLTRPPLWAPVGKSWLVAYYDAGVRESLSLSSGRVVQADDLSGNGRHATQPIASRQPPYLESDPRAGGLAAWGAQTSAGRVGLVTPSISAMRAYFSSAYKSGTDASFDDFNALFSGDGEFGRWRIIGSPGSTDLRSSNAGASFAESMRMNGAGATSTVLPMPLSVLGAESGSVRTQPCFIGHYGDLDGRTWPGPIRAILFTDGSESDADRDRIEGWRAHRDGIRLVQGHPYRDAPPYEEAA